VGIGAFIGAVFKAIGQAAKSEIEGKQVLEDAVTAARERLAANPNQVLTLLSDAEADAAQSSSYLWRIFFGRAVERAAAAEPRVQEIFDYVGQGNRPVDFLLKATRSGYEVTTDLPPTVAKHVARPAVDQVISYARLILP
jgi:hypothetical protein